MLQKKIFSTHNSVVVIEKESLLKKKFVTYFYTKFLIYHISFFSKKKIVLLDNYLNSFTIKIKNKKKFLKHFLLLKNFTFFKGSLFVFKHSKLSFYFFISVSTKKYKKKNLYLALRNINLILRSRNILFVFKVLRGGFLVISKEIAGYFSKKHLLQSKNSIVKHNNYFLLSRFTCLPYSITRRKSFLVYPCSTSKVIRSKFRKTKTKTKKFKFFFNSNIIFFKTFLAKLKKINSRLIKFKRRKTVFSSFLKPKFYTLKNLIAYNLKAKVQITEQEFLALKSAAIKFQAHKLKTKKTKLIGFSNKNCKLEKVSTKKIKFNTLKTNTLELKNSNFKNIKAFMLQILRSKFKKSLKLKIKKVKLQNWDRINLKDTFKNLKVILFDSTIPHFQWAYVTNLVAFAYNRFEPVNLDLYSDVQMELKWIQVCNRKAFEPLLANSFLIRRFSNFKFKKVQGLKKTQSLKNYFHMLFLKIFRIIRY